MVTCGHRQVCAGQWGASWAARVCRHPGGAGAPVSVVTALGRSSAVLTTCGRTGRPEELTAPSLLRDGLRAARPLAPQQTPEVFRHLVFGESLPERLGATVEF